MTNGTVSFHYTAASIWGILEDLMLSGKWKVALEICLDSGFDHPAATKLLDGQISLVDDVEEGVVSADQPNPEYQKVLHVQRAGWCWFGEFKQRLFRPSALIIVTDPEKNPVSGYVPYQGSDYGQRQWEWKKDWYRNHGSDPAHTEVSKVFDLVEGVAVLWEEQDRGVIPSWVPDRNITHDPQVALKEYLNAGLSLSEIKPVLQRRDLFTESLSTQLQNIPIAQFDELVVDEPAINLEPIRAEILAKNRDEWITLTAKEDDFSPRTLEKVADILGQSLRVPAKPFLNWVKLILEKGKEEELMSAPAWQTVSPMGLKMGFDNPLHSDWVVGAGLDPETFYESGWNDVAFSYASDYQDRLRPLPPARQLTYNCLLFAGRGVVEGEVVFPEPDQPVAPGQIAVTPTAGKEYQMALMSACKDGQGCVISAVGGRLCHLSIVGRELGARFVMLKDACTVLQPGDRVRVNLDEKTIQII